MEVWDQRFVDLEGPGFLEFDADRQGKFQFCAVHGWIDYRISNRPEGPMVEFSWEGTDDGNPCCGRGWALHSDSQLRGRFFIHNGDDSGFTASHMPATRTRSK
jgi:hypothetical protein